MASVSVTINIEGDPDESIAALRRIAGVDDVQPATIVVASGSPEAEPAPVPAPSSSAAAATRTSAQMPTRYQRLWENGASGQARRQPAAEPPPTPAQWDGHLCNELVNNMTDAGRRLVAVLAASGADGVTRESLTAQLGIAVDAVRTTQVSIGHAMRRVQRDNGNISLPRPVEFHRDINTYMLNADFRTAIQAKA